MVTIAESTAEEAALTWLAELGYEIGHGPELVPHERDDYKQVVLVGRWDRCHVQAPANG